MALLFVWHFRRPRIYASIFRCNSFELCFRLHSLSIIYFGRRTFMCELNQDRWDPWFKARTMHIFAKCVIRVYTDLYPDIQCSYAYIRSCISMYAFIRVYTQIHSVHTRIYSRISVCTLSYVYIRSCTCIYWFVHGTDQDILSIRLHLSHIIFQIVMLP